MRSYAIQGLLSEWSDVVAPMKVQSATMEELWFVPAPHSCFGFHVGGR